MKKVTPSILGTVRAEGYSKGWGQAYQLRFDDVRESGRADGYDQAAGRFKAYWAFGFICGVLAAIAAQYVRARYVGI